MDIQFYGANCVALTYKGNRLVVDDNLASLGGKDILRSDDIVLFTGEHPEVKVQARLIVDQPGEYEVGDFSITGIAAQAHMDDSTKKLATIYKITAGDVDVLITGHIYPDLSNAQQEAIGTVDVMVVPVGGNGYTLDAVGALKVIKDVEPKLVIPTHYADKALGYEVPQQDLAAALKELGMEPKETTAKLKLKSADFPDTTQLIVLEKS